MYPFMPWWKTAAVLVGFPLLFWIYSQALLHREVFRIGEIDFFITFWLGATVIYTAKIVVIWRLLASEGRRFADIGLELSRKRILVVTGTFFAVALSLVAFVEVSVAHLSFDPERLASMRGLYPDTTPKRLVFVLMAFTAGLSEEITYRGFAIRSFQGFGINPWLAIPIAAIPFVFQHGLKSLDQFWWFFIWALVLGAIYVGSKRLLPGIIIHWFIILFALFGIFTALEG